jgi:hypothetical protein
VFVLIRYFLILILLCFCKALVAQESRNQLSVGLYQPVFSRWSDITTSAHVAYQFVGKKGNMFRFSLQHGLFPEYYYSRYQILVGINPETNEYLWENVEDVYRNFFYMSNLELGERIERLSSNNYATYALIGFQFGNTFTLTFQNSIGLHHTRKLTKNFSLVVNYSIFADLIDAHATHSALSLSIGYDF